MNQPVEPLPAVTSLTKALSEGLRDDVRLQHCTACGFVIYYPRVCCPRCLCLSLDWRPVAGTGELLSFATIWRPLHPAFLDRVPLWLCSVRLSEGPVVMALLDGVSSRGVSVGMPVRIVAVELGSGIRVPRFVPGE